MDKLKNAVAFQWLLITATLVAVQLLLGPERMPLKIILILGILGMVATMLSRWAVSATVGHIAALRLPLWAVVVLNVGAILLVVPLAETPFSWGGAALPLMLITPALAYLTVGGWRRAHR